MTREARTGTDDVLPDAPQPSLPFDGVADAPIPYSLTARARRTVAPDDLPALRVISDPPAPTTPADAGAAQQLDDERSDTRPARARALARAGTPLPAIAQQLDVDELLVEA
jgi:hypothetical protein